MALYSCNLSSVGKTTHAVGTAGAHLRYIGRDGVNAYVLCEYMPSDPQKARSWMDGQERDDRKNARMIDKIRVALPLELNEAQRAVLINDYMAEITRGRVPWYAAIHQTGKDAHNPHAHIVLRDRDIETGKRVVCLSDSKRDWRKKGMEGDNPVDYVREKWERHTNRAYEMHGIDKRVDRRTLQAQGIDRIPTIHLGANGQHVDKFKCRPQSQDRPETTWRKEYRDKIPYTQIDQGRTRAERNAEIIDFNLERAARSKDLATALAAQAEKQLAVEDREIHCKHTAIRRRIRAQEDNVKAQHRETINTLFQQRRDKAGEATAQEKERLQASLQEMQDSHRLAAEHLQCQHDSLKARFMRGLDITGRIRKKHEKEKQNLTAMQAAERKRKERESYSDENIRVSDILNKHTLYIRQAEDNRTAHLQQLKTRHAADYEHIEREQQAQEARRDQVRIETAEKARLYKQAAKAKQQESKTQQRPTQARSSPPPKNDNTRTAKPNNGGIQAKPVTQPFNREAEQPAAPKPNEERKTLSHADIQAARDEAMKHGVVQTREERIAELQQQMWKRDRGYER